MLNGGPEQAGNRSLSPGARLDEVLPHQGVKVILHPKGEGEWQTNREIYGPFAT